MWRIAGFFGLVISLFFVMHTPLLASWPWSDSTLVTVNGQNYTKEDFNVWWEHWQEDGMPFPATVDPFIDWNLLASEAEQMELYNEPDFRQKIDVFLKARTLLLYQSEKINSKINFTDDDLQDLYQKKYLPRLQLHVLYFNDAETAAKTFSLMQAENIDFSQIFEDLRSQNKDVFYEEKITRKSSLPKEWRDALQLLEIGNVSRPFIWSKGFVIIYFAGEMGGEKADFEKFRPILTSEIKNIKENELSVQLLEDLKRKYNVKVDMPLLESIDVNGDNQGIADKNLITIGNEKYPVHVFMGFLKKEQKFRRQYGYHVEEDDKFKKKILDGVVAQTLTTRGALDEHYEEKEPFKSVFQFYRQHRLIKELEDRLFSPDVKVSEEEIKRYYDENLDHFSRPSTVSISVLEDEENLINKMYGQLQKGADFRQVASSFYADEIPVEEMPVNSLDPLVQSVLSKMIEGEVSSPFFVNGHFAILHLVERTEAVPMPFDHVQEKIAKTIDKEKFAGLRDDYLSRLREKSQVKINARVWEKIKKEHLHAGK